MTAVADVFNDPRQGGPVLLERTEPWPNACRFGQRHTWMQVKDGPRACGVCGRINGHDGFAVNLRRHGWMLILRAALVQVGAIKGLAAESAQRRKQREDFAAPDGPRAEAYERDGHACQFWAFVQAALDDGRVEELMVTAEFACWGRLDPQHVIPQGRCGPDDASNLVSLCRRHHDWVEEHPEIARYLGLTKATEATS